MMPQLEHAMRGITMQERADPLEVEDEDYWSDDVKLKPYEHTQIRIFLER